MTNEEVLKVFLKKHRKYTRFKEILKTSSKKGKTIPISEIFWSTFIWFKTPEGDPFWRNLSAAWVKMSKDFNLSGMVDLKII